LKVLEHGKLLQNRVVMGLHFVGIWLGWGWSVWDCVRIGMNHQTSAKWTSMDFAWSYQKFWLNALMSLLMYTNIPKYTLSVTSDQHQEEHPDCKLILLQEFSG